MANIPVSIFNTSSLPLQVSVNRGQPVAVSGTGPGQNWVPQQSAPATFLVDYNPPYRKFCTRTIQVDKVNIDGAPTTLLLLIPMPNAQIISLQLYIFSEGGSRASWVLLDDGIMVGQGATPIPTCSTGT